MAVRHIDRPCAFCGKPADSLQLYTLRVRAHELRPTRIPTCAFCRKNEPLLSQHHNLKEMRPCPHTTKSS